ncbi:bifunctional phosphopantothenoylcysteine decarboxylase/phosphopantothenate--cysteine ligase CoaBC [Myxococcota bacterium]|nr:bifunctional phosphopantothenoylcysteine decarboxylase/phosphopantothenate--cysteine ligase CoaBC [Myxococcota bacterium]
MTRNILLGIGGGIAAYKAPQLVRDLMARGFTVKTILTKNGARFVSELALSTVSGSPVYGDMFSAERSDIDHIALAQWADYLLIAPATANILAKMAHGLADDLLSTTVLATKAPVYAAPGMNTNMWEHEATQKNVAILVERGVRFIGPESGELACGVTGMGRMSQPAHIAQSMEKGALPGLLSGRSVLVSAGATREHLDPARFISNPSTGRMGIAMALAARDMGARVVLIHGHLEEPLPRGIQCESALSVAAMADAILARAPQMDCIIMAAAVGDFTPANPSIQKMKKEGQEEWSLSLKPTVDILKTLGSMKARGECRALLVGFAAETASGQVLADLARTKLAVKGCDALVANDISRSDRGFQATQNAVTLVDRNGNTLELPLASKQELARQILPWVLKTAFLP